MTDPCQDRVGLIDTFVALGFAEIVNWHMFNCGSLDS